MTSDVSTLPPLTGEPALEDVFADPIVQAIMRVDGLVEADLRTALTQAKQARTRD